MIRQAVLAAALLAGASQAHAYCVYNETDREVTVVQEHHPSPSREERRLNQTVAPRSSVCCKSHVLDCNPEGRENSVVGLAIVIPGQPSYGCGFPEGSETAKVTGAGTIRILPNPRKSAFPYVVRVRTHDGKDITGPRGVACTELKQGKTKGSK